MHSSTWLAAQPVKNKIGNQLLQEPGALLFQRAPGSFQNSSFMTDLKKSFRLLFAQHFKVCKSTLCQNWIDHRDSNCIFQLFGDSNRG